MSRMNSCKLANDIIEMMFEEDGKRIVWDEVTEFVSVLRDIKSSSQDSMLDRLKTIVYADKTQS